MLMASKTIVGAMVRALLLWVFVYIGLAHFFVYWNWEATDGEFNASATASVVVKEETQKDDPDPVVVVDEQLPVWDPEELNALLAETPLAKVELIALLHDPIPEEIATVPDERDTLKRTIQQLEGEWKALQHELREWQAQHKALETAQQELTAALQQRAALQQARAQQQLHNEDATVEIKESLPSSNTSKPLWKTVESRVSRWQRDMPRFTHTTHVNSTLAPLLTQALSQVKDLSQLTTSAQVEDHFLSLLVALDAHVRSAPPTDWAELTRVLRGAHNHTTSTMEPQCRTFAPDLSAVLVVDEDEDEDDDEEDDEDDPSGILWDDLPTEDDVHDLLDEYRDAWYEAFDLNPFPLVTEEALERTTQLKDSLVQHWTERATTHVQDSLQRQFQQKQRAMQYQQQRRGGGQCVRLDQVDGLVQAGLNALERNQDLNGAILTELNRQGVETQNVILDAVLDRHEDDDTVMPQLMDVKWTWRQVLDRPWTKTVTHVWLPALVDLIGGYMDPLDQWLDQNLPTQGGGKVALQNLLDRAGRYPLPQPVAAWLKAKHEARR